MVEQPSKPGYLPALDGLRGVAIALVVVFHVFVGRVSSGVDVFLFLGGVLFVNTQLSNATREGGLTAGQSALRLVRRLFPALLLVVATATVVLILTEPPVGWRTPLEQAAAGVLHVENWYLYEKTSGYATATAAAPPFQHLWSMSVQLQIYLVIIAVVYAVCWAARKLGFRARRALAVVLALATAASFAAATGLLIAGYGDLNYYATYTRFWEIGLGGLFGLWALKRRPALNTGAQVAAGVGLATICLVGLVIDGQAQFPGPAALIPLGAAALIVLASMGRARGGIVGLLESGPARTLGAWSYSLYLWHWPILIVGARTLPIGDHEELFGVGVIAVSLLAAWATHRFVEVPLRQRGKPERGRVWRPAYWAKAVRSASSRALAPAAAVCVVAALVLVLGPRILALGIRVSEDKAIAKAEEIGGVEVAYPGAAATLDGAPVPPGMPILPNPAARLNKTTQANVDDCATGGHEWKIARTKNNGEPCRYGDVDSPHTLYLVGGSHSEIWLDVLADIGRDRGFAVEPYIKWGCPIFYVDKENREGNNCYRWSEEVEAHVNENPPDVGLFLVVTRPEGPGGNGLDYVPDTYLEAVARLGASGAKIFGLRDNPWVVTDSGGELYVPHCVSDHGPVERCGMPVDETMSPTNPAEEAFPGDQVTRIDLTDAFVVDGRVEPVIGNLLVFRDGHHITPEFTRTLRPELERQMFGSSSVARAAAR